MDNVNPGAQVPKKRVSNLLDNLDNDLGEYGFKEDSTEHQFIDAWNSNDQSIIRQLLPEIDIYMNDGLIVELMMISLSEYDIYKQKMFTHILDEKIIQPLENNGLILIMLYLAWLAEENDMKKFFHQEYLKLLDKSAYLVIKDKNAILELYNKCLSSDDLNYTVIPIKSVHNPLLFIKAGFLPCLDTNLQIGLEYYINGMSYDDIKFWTGSSKSYYILKNLSTYPIWIYKSIESHKKHAIELADSLPLILYAPEFIYKKSKRPINNMSLFRGSIAQTAKKSDIINNTLISDGIKWNVIPVTRYASGMSKGLYHDHKDYDTEFCGTFYFNEVESSTYLRYMTSRKFLSSFRNTETRGS